MFKKFFINIIVIVWIFLKVVIKAWVKEVCDPHG